ncbi:HAD-IIA family hydrolase [Bacillus sp. AK128]
MTTTHHSLLHKSKAYLFDLDGCIYFGNLPAPGSLELLRQLKEDQKDILFVTNNSTETAYEVSAKLKSMGLSVEANEVVTATECVGLYLYARYGSVKVKVAGSHSLKETLRKQGHQVLDLEQSERADYMVIGRDTTFHYMTLQYTVNEITKGAKPISTNPDEYHLGGKHELVPETGSLVAAIEAITRKKIKSVGKPEPYIFKFALDKLNYQPHECLMIGDNPHTDILGGYKAGLHTIWLKGNQVDLFKENSVDFSPSLTAHDISDLLNLYKTEMNIL